jgi:hypothetical protein
MGVKPIYKINTMSRNGWISYSSVETGKELGYWDPYRPTKDEFSQLTGDMRKVILSRLEYNFERYGRKIMTILVSFMEAGIMCGFEPVYVEDFQIVSWTAKDEKRGIPLEFAEFLALSGRWKNKQSEDAKSSRLIRELLQSGAFLRFIVDTNSSRRISLWSMPKMRIR